MKNSVVSKAIFSPSPISFYGKDFTVSSDSWLALQGILGRFFIAQTAVSAVVICSWKSEGPTGPPLLAQQPLSHRNSWKSVRGALQLKHHARRICSRSLFSSFQGEMRTWRKKPRFHGQQAMKIMWSLIETRETGRCSRTFKYPHTHVCFQCSRATSDILPHVAITVSLHVFYKQNLKWNIKALTGYINLLLASDHIEHKVYTFTYTYIHIYIYKIDVPALYN